MPSPPQFDDQFRRGLLTWRRDVRRFRPAPLPPGTIGRLIELAALAPSVGLSEPWRFQLVEARSAKISRRAMRPPSRRGRPIDRATGQGRGRGRRTMPETLEYSAVAAVHTLWLAARAEGIGLGWVPILDPEEIAAILETPVDWKLIGYLCLGFPDAEDNVPELERRGWEVRRGAPFLLRR
jgi:5,6-dimethylbenzimidazole synthase